MKLREALKKSGWEAFKNNQNEEWNTIDLLNQFPNNKDKWLDSDCTISKDMIIDYTGDELTEIN